MARYVLLEFEKEEDAEEFAGDVGVSNYIENGARSGPYNVQSVMLLAGEGDKEDTEEVNSASNVVQDLDNGGLTNVCSV